MHILIFAWLLLADIALCDSCDISPVALPITDNVLSNGKRRRGILATVGTPPQNISFMVHTYLNSTWIYNSTKPLCGNTTTATQCLTSRGGLYDPSGSSTYTSHTNVYSAGGSASDVQRTLGTHVWDNVFATDTFHLSTNVSLPDFPIGIPGFDFGGEYDRQANIGLGQNSTLLQRLKSSARIPSLSWSYWWGVSNSASSSATPGQIVFGGYDAAKVSGKPFTQTLQAPSAACQSGMTFSFTNLILRFPNGTALDLNPSRVLTGCVQPDFPAVMSIPADPYFWRWMNVTETRWIGRSEGTHWFMPMFSPGNVYAGGLDIQVQGGPVISIPNDVLVVPDEFIDKAGAVQRNNSAAVLLLSPNDGPNVNDQLIVGMSFFSGAYLSVDHEEKTWTVWAAKATKDENIIAFGDGCNSTKPVTGSGPKIKNEEGETKGSRPDGMSTTAKIGIAVGASIIAVLLAVLACLFIVRKRRSQRDHRPIGSATDLNSDRNWSRQCDIKSSDTWALQEMDAPRAGPNELYAARPPVELYDWSGNQWGTKTRGSRSAAVELPVMRN